MANELELYSMVAIVGFITFLTRALPFIVFKKHANSKILKFLKLYMPVVILPILVVYCLKDYSLLDTDFWTHEGLCLGLVVLIHLLFRQSLLSIALPLFLYVYLKNGALF